MPEKSGPNLVLYTRNGFAGPMATMVREQYPPSYTCVSGVYAPRILDLHGLDAEAFADPRALPVAVLKDSVFSVEVNYRREAAPFALRNVFADEVHVILGGTATLETEFGVMPVEKDDLILIPRATSYRFSDIIGELREAILVSPTELTSVMEVGLGPLQRKTTPTPYADPSLRDGRYETVIRHGEEFTSVFTDFDPLPTIATDGATLVSKININDVRSINMASGLLLPPLMFDDHTTNNLVYDLSSRRGDRPPVHYNADYDECILYLAGPGKWGSVDTPGLITHTPKGFPHQGPVENVPEGYRAILIETRAKLKVTAAGYEIAKLAETDQYSIHPSQAQSV